MRYSQVINPAWGNLEKTVINCNVFFDDFNEFLPFTANPDDTSNPSSKSIFNECASGKWGDVAEYVEPAPYVPNADDNKEKAKKLLADTDWTAANDVGDPTKANPYLANQADFITWRNEVRAIVFNPVDGWIDIFNQKPVEDWQSA